MKSWALLVVASFVALMANAKTPQSPPTTASVPPSPSIDKGACPFECCTYRDWIANEEIALLDQPNGKKVVARIRKGEQVHAITGEVHSIPLRVVAKFDEPEAGIKVGDIIYVLHPVGEGGWKVWHNGHLVESENVPDKGPYPRSTWWVQLKTRSGIIGWTISHGNFSNQEACG